MIALTVLLTGVTAWLLTRPAADGRLTANPSRTERARTRAGIPRWAVPAASVLADPGIDDARFALALAGCPPKALQERVVAGGAPLGYNGWSRYAEAMREVYAAAAG